MKYVSRLSRSWSLLRSIAESMISRIRSTEAAVNILRIVIPGNCSTSCRQGPISNLSTYSATLSVYGNSIWSRNLTTTRGPYRTDRGADVLELTGSSSQFTSNFIQRKRIRSAAGSNNPWARSVPDTTTRLDTGVVHELGGRKKATCPNVSLDARGGTTRSPASRRVGFLYHRWLLSSVRQSRIDVLGEIR